MGLEEKIAELNDLLILLPVLIVSDDEHRDQDLEDCHLEKKVPRVVWQSDKSCTSHQINKEITVDARNVGDSLLEIFFFFKFSKAAAEFADLGTLVTSRSRKQDRSGNY